MQRSLRVLSLLTKFIFYGMMAYFLFLAAGVLSGTYRFTDSSATFSYLVASSGMAAASLLFGDLHAFLVKRDKRKNRNTDDSPEGR